MSAQINTSFNLKLVECAPFDIVANGTTLFINTENGCSFSIEFDSIASMKKLGNSINDAIKKADKDPKTKTIEEVESDSGSSTGSSDEDEDDNLIGAIANFNIRDPEDGSDYEADEIVETQQLF